LTGNAFAIVVLQWLVWRKYFDWRIWASLIPIVGGILLTSVTELSFNMFGFLAALVGCLATSTKTILAESLLHGYKFDRYSLIHWHLFLNFYAAFQPKPAKQIPKILPTETCVSV